MVQQIVTIFAIFINQLHFSNFVVCFVVIHVQVNISMLARYIFQILGSLVIMFIQSAKLTGVLLSVIPIVAIGAVQYGKLLYLNSTICKRCQTLRLEGDDMCPRT